MEKLVVLKLDGDFETQGFRVTLEIRIEGEYRPDIEIVGYLPCAPEMPNYIQKWQQNYRSIGAPYRIKPGKISYDGSVNSGIQECQESAKVLRDRLKDWLNCEEFRELDKRLREELKRDEIIRCLIRTENKQIQKLPWHLWDVIERYPKAEVALSALKSERPKKLLLTPRAPKIRILAILGHSEGIDIEADRQLLEQLPDSEIVFLPEPQHEKINEQLWEQSWDIIFFAGHSETEGDVGRIYINPTDSLTISELWYGLRKAVERGLKLAIFNSCDGLGLARQLDDLQIPQMIVMRELVPDRVAQQFLKHFLTAFANGESFYLSVRQARERLHDDLEREFPCASWLPAIWQNPSGVPLTWEDLLEKKAVKEPKNNIKASKQTYVTENFQPNPLSLKKPGSRKKNPSPNWKTVLLTSMVCAAIVMGLRSLGALQPWELQAYDWLMRSRPDEGMDNRLLLVAIDEKDVQWQPIEERKNASLSDRSLAQLLEKLEPLHPTAIGLQLYREQGANLANLSDRLKQNDRFFAICKYGNDSKPGVGPPPEIPSERQGFINVLLDPDGAIRRHLLAVTTSSPCTSPYSFSFQLAERYLEDNGIKVQNHPDFYLQFNKTVFKSLEKDTSGYYELKNFGNQIMLNYRATPHIAPQLTLKQILSEPFNPDLVKNRIVIIGTVDPSFNDHRWLTPYSGGQWPIKPMTGIEIQAQMTSQILSAVLDNRPLIRWWPKSCEALWIWGWSLIGGAIALVFQSRSQLKVAAIITLGILCASCWLLLIRGDWIPLLPSALALLATAASVRIYTRFQNRQK